MAFDVEKYMDAMDKFHTLMANVWKPESPQIGRALDEVCQILRVAKVDIKWYEATNGEKRKEERYIPVYECGESDEKEVYIKRETTPKGDVAVYGFYKKNDGVAWSEEESRRVSMLQKCLFAYNGRSRLALLAEQFTFRDMQLGLYNLNFFMKHTGSLIADGSIGRYGACYFNLKHFSTVNQRFGRDTGTRIMVEYIGRLQAFLDEPELVCRIGGDNFIVLFLKEKLELVVGHMEGVEIAVEDEGDSVIVSAVAGYYMVDQPIQQPFELMDRTSVALNVAKHSKTTDKVFYSQELLEMSNERKRIEAMFPDAIRNEEFQVYYQPKIYMKDYKLKGAEALCRWFHEGKIVPPDQFIPVLEQSKHICELDFYMLDHVCADIRRWLDAGKRVVRVSVNLSRRHMGNRHLLQKILDTIDGHGVPHEYIEIELTETTTDVGFDDLKFVVNGLRERGISTSVDDFGVGYSSFNLIREVPWNVVKIDKSFLCNIEDELSGKNRAMLKYIIAIAQELGMVTICEGVETVEQVKLLKEFGCFMAQGFYFDRPLPWELFEEKL